MQYRHELVRLEEGLNVKIYVHSILDVTAHWHHELELLMVLKGSVDVQKENQHFVMQADDLLLLNPNELHAIKATSEDNVLLAIQFSPDMLSNFYPELLHVVFDCNSTKEGEQENFDRVRAHLAKIIWSFVKKKHWFKFTIEQELMALIETLVTSFPTHLVEKNHQQLRERELERLTRIVQYIEQHYGERIQLQQLAEKECVTVHHLSRFFKERMGIAFQEYLFDYRLYRASNRIVMGSDKISDIALECGFNDPKLFYRKFREKYQLTPVELRRQRSAAYPVSSLASYMTVDDNDIYKPLFKYLNTTLTHPPKPKTRLQTTTLNLCNNLGSLTPVWSQIMTFGCAYEGLKSEVQQQMRYTQAELKFKYARFQGIFVDQMQIVVSAGRYQWRYVNELFDFLLSINLKPFVCLGFTPEQFASGQHTVAQWRGNVTPPKQLELWQDLLSEFFYNILERYGEQEVSSWYFEAWNEPDLEGIFWADSQDAYHQLYLATYQTARRVNRNIRLGGPSVSHMAFSQGAWLDNFVAFCVRENLQPDFFSYHIYPEKYGAFDSLESTQNVSRRSMGPDGCRELIELGKKAISPLAIKEQHITEWNVSAVWGNRLLDTAYTAAFIVQNALKLYDKVDSLAIWTFSDLFDERGPAIDTFHGGFGLQTREGIPKPSYHAISLLNRMGKQVIARNNNYLVSRSENEFQILMVNYVHFDELYASGDISAIEIIDPYSAFNPHPQQEFCFELDIAKGHYRLTRYTLSREHGSAYDEWQKMGAPCPLDEDDIAQLKRDAWPSRVSESIAHPGGKFQLSASLSEHAVELILISLKS